MAYEWPEFNSTSGFITTLNVQFKDASENVINATGTFSVGLGDPSNSGWVHFNRFNNNYGNYGVGIGVPFLSDHPINITPVNNTGDVLSPLGWSQGDLFKYVTITRTFLLNSNNVTRTDTYRVLQKYLNGKTALVLLPENSGIITSINDTTGIQSIQHKESWLSDVIILKGINLSIFKFSKGYYANNGTKYNNAGLVGYDFAKVGVSYYNEANIINPFTVGDTGTGWINAGSYGVSLYYPLRTLYSEQRTLFTIIPVYKPTITISPTTGSASGGETITISSNRDINGHYQIWSIGAEGYEILRSAGIAGFSPDSPNKKTFIFTNPQDVKTFRAILKYNHRTLEYGQQYSNPNNISSSNLFYKPIIISETPQLWTGSSNSYITIFGQNVLDTTSVKINGVGHQFSKSTTSNNTIFISINEQTTSGKIELTSPAGTVTSVGNFTLQPAPTVSSFTPTSGLSGAEVIITGTNFVSAVDNQTPVVGRVSFGNWTATFTDVTPTTIRAFVPSGAVTGPISVTTNGGTATSTSNFTRNYPPTLFGVGIYKDANGTENNLAPYLDSERQYVIWGGGLDTTQKIEFFYTNNPNVKYEATFTVIDASRVSFTVPFMNNLTTGGLVKFTLTSAYGTVTKDNAIQLQVDLRNINYPTISSYQAPYSNNTTPVNTLVGANLYFENSSTWEKANDIYFAKPVTRHDGLSDSAEWTRATAGWFSNNGEWQKFWPSVENAAKKFYKFDWSSAGFTERVDVLKVVPDYPNLYALLSESNGKLTTSAGYPDSWQAIENCRSIIAKINLQTGVMSYIEVKGPRNNTNCHISDIYVSGDSVYAVGYDHASDPNFGEIAVNNLHRGFKVPARFVVGMLSSGDVVIVGGQTQRHFVGVVKKYSKNLALQFSRKISSPPVIAEPNGYVNNFTTDAFFFKAIHMPGGYAYNPLVEFINGGSLYEPKITLFNGALYVFFSSSKNYANIAYYGASTNGAWRLREEILVKKLKPTNLTEYVGETSVRSLMQHDIAADPSLDWNYRFQLHPTSPTHYDFFKGYHPTVNKSGFSQYSVVADPQLNGNNKINFTTGYFWNSLQINPTIKSAFMARDGVFDYPLIMGDLESTTGDDDGNGMFVGHYGKNDLYSIMCGTEFENGRVSTTDITAFSDLNSFLANYSTLPLVYTSSSFPTTAFTVTETPVENLQMTEVCNA